MRPAGFDFGQFVLLLKLLRTLGARRELASQSGLHAATMAMAAGIAFLFGGLFSLVVLSGQIALASVVSTCFLVTTFFLLPTLMSEAADSLLNPAEASVLSARPVRDSTYLLAKLSYVVLAALAIAVPFNVLPALAGLTVTNARWYFPITHLVTVVATASLAAVAISGLFGVLFRVTSPGRVRQAALWMQLLGACVMPAAPYLMRLADVRLAMTGPGWSAVPVTWFAWAALAGHAERPVLHWPVAAPAMIVTAALMAVGIRTLSAGYMVRVNTAVRSRRVRRPPSSSRTGSRAWGWLTRTPAARGGAAFVAAMMRRDWQFRRQVIGGVMGLIVPFVVVMARAGDQSPFVTGRGFTPVHLVPHLIGLVIVAVCQFMPHTDAYRARWIFLTVPASALRGMVRGTYAALWWTGAWMPALVIAAVGTWLWGFVEGALYASYTLAVTSFYLSGACLLINGLPFTRPPNPSKAAGALGATVLFLIVAALIGFVQARYVFPRVPVILGVTLVFVLASSLAARGTFRLLERRVLDAVSGHGGWSTMRRT